MSRTGLLILLLGIATIAKAQPKGASVWVTVQLPVDFSAKWQWHNDISYKSNGTSLKTYQRLYRTGLRYRISDHLNVAAGVGFVSTATSGNKGDDEFGKEFRIWQELIYQHSLTSKWSFQNRLRPEERFLAATTQKDAYRILNLSDKVSFIRPISKKWDMGLTDEFFEQVIDKVLVYNQNRLSGVSFFNISKSLQLQSAYIWVLRKTFSQHAIQFTIRKIFSAYVRHDHSSE